MKKRTKKITKELGKSRRQINRETRQEQMKKEGAKRRSNGNGLKKNLRKKQPISFQVASKRSLKFCKRIALTEELRKLLGRGIMKIIPLEVRKRPEMLPCISVYRDTKNNKLILSIDSAEYEDNIVADENGNAKFQPDFEYSKKRFKQSA